MSGDKRLRIVRFSFEFPAYTDSDQKALSMLREELDNLGSLQDCASVDLAADAGYLLPDGWEPNNKDEYRVPGTDDTSWDEAVELDKVTAPPTQK